MKEVREGQTNELLSEEAEITDIKLLYQKKYMIISNKGCQTFLCYL